MSRPCAGTGAATPYMQRDPTRRRDALAGGPRVLDARTRDFTCDRLSYRVAVTAGGADARVLEVRVRRKGLQRSADHRSTHDRDREQCAVGSPTSVTRRQWRPTVRVTRPLRPSNARGTGDRHPSRTLDRDGSASDEPDCAVARVPSARCVSVAVAARARPSAMSDIRGSGRVATIRERRLDGGCVPAGTARCSPAAPAVGKID